MSQQNGESAEAAIESQIKVPSADSGCKVSTNYANLVYHTFGGDDPTMEYFERHGITREMLEDPNAKIPFDPLCDAIFELIDTLNIPDAGLSIGTKLHVSNHGALGMAVLSSGTIGQAIHDAAKYYQTSITFCDLRVGYEDDNVVIEIVETHNQPQVQTFLVEAMMLTIQNALEFVSGQQLTCATVVFGFPPPPHAEDYPNFFTGEIRFNGDRHAMILPKEVLDKRCITADEQIHKLAEEQLQKKMQEMRSDKLAIPKVLEIMRKRPDQMPTLEELATSFNVSSRTMIRYLQAESTSYRELRDSVHRELATEALRNTDRSVDSIALELGYQDSASFRRAFKRWCECSPSEYRNQTAAKK